ncbi:hypothetical protein FBEOM_2523 [Fusarium beomiforme]|uniref:Fungal N-terminal domain-containing protein n=1 Tax=Fusarium beomiforme TaxID=44412 RepID=A0A9P5DZV8_9HYPO|nr:hypothetical protein FBEOM_2523 [Fusarium beomiforme]
MDGLSVAASCIAVIQVADQTYKIISQFVRDCKDAKGDLAVVSQERSTLTRTLTQLKDLIPDGSEFAGSDLTNNTKRDIHEIISSCLTVSRDIQDVLSGHEGRLASLSWATRGKRKVATSKVLLETNRRALSLAVDTITMHVDILFYAESRTDYFQKTAQNIRRDTTNILDDSTYMKGDIHDLIARIRNLEAIIADRDPNDPRTYMLMRYLDDLSSVAGSVCDMSSRPATPEPHGSLNDVSIVKVHRTTTPNGKSKIKSQSQIMPQSNDVATVLFAFSRMDQTVNAVRYVGGSTILYTWKLHEDWFVDTGLVSQIQEPTKLLLPAYDGQEEIAIVGLVFGSSNLVLAMKFPEVSCPEDIIITGRELPADSSHSAWPLPLTQRGGTYTYGRWCSNGQAFISEKRKFIQIQCSVAYGQVVRDIYFMHANQLALKKSNEWNIFSPNLDQWARMGKANRSGNRKPRIYLETYQLRWPQEYQST